MSVTTLEDTVRTMLEEPAEQTYRLRLLDRLEEETPDAGRAALDLVLAHRANDGPRLLYAEWCDRNGRPERAAWIRLGLAHRKVSGGTCRVLRRDCYYDVPEEWPDDWVLTTHRGFVRGADLRAEDWIVCGHEMIRSHPIESVCLRTWPALETHLDAPRGVLRISLQGLERVVRLSEREVVNNVSPAGELAKAARRLLELEFPGVVVMLPTLPAIDYSDTAFQALLQGVVDDVVRTNWPAGPLPKVVLQGEGGENYAAAKLANEAFQRQVLGRWAPDPRLSDVDREIVGLQKLLRDHLARTGSRFVAGPDGSFRVEPQAGDYEYSLREHIRHWVEFRERARREPECLLGASDIRRAFGAWMGMRRA